MNPTVTYALEWGLLFERQGLPRIAGVIWGWLLVADTAEQSQEDLMARLGVAKGSVSTNVRLLERVGFVERVASGRGRGTRYRIRADAYEALMREKYDSTVLWLRRAERGLELARRYRSLKSDRIAALRRF